MRKTYTCVIMKQYILYVCKPPFNYMIRDRENPNQNQIGSNFFTFSKAK